MNRRYLISLLAICTMLLCSCGKASKNNSEAKKITDNAAVVMGDSESDKITAWIQFDINPSYTIGITDDNRVYSIVGNNADAEDVINNQLKGYFDGIDDGVPIDNVLPDIATATAKSGYALDDFTVDVKVVSGKVDENVINSACMQSADAVYEEYNIPVSFHSDDISVDVSIAGEEDNGPVTCPDCGGSGTIVCDLCNGERNTVTIQEHEEQVRNDYVCPVCGGSGMVNDGMHGDESAVCGNCGGGSSMASGDFNALAYDTVIVEEEVLVPCNRCDGSGTTICNRCDGKGVE